MALDEHVAERAASAAAHEGLSLSAWLNRAAGNSLPDLAMILSDEAVQVLQDLNP